MRGVPAWHRPHSVQHPSSVLALRADPPSPTRREGKTRDHASSQTFSKCCSRDWCCSQPCTPLRNVR
ncbi:MAG: hypothetical protein EOR08_06475 [Mesorhizobium sp.]|nr:MAG: hypothetical protein EOR08_06475 [Mesorhizobium sp.]